MLVGNHYVDGGLNSDSRHSWEGPAGVDSDNVEHRCTQQSQWKILDRTNTKVRFWAGKWGYLRAVSVIEGLQPFWNMLLEGSVAHKPLLNYWVFCRIKIGNTWSMTEAECNNPKRVSRTHTLERPLKNIHTNVGREVVNGHIWEPQIRRSLCCRILQN